MIWDMFGPNTPDDGHGMFEGIFLVILLLAVVAGVVAVTQAQRKVPVQHAQRAVGRKVYAGGSSFMPLRVNYSGVMPLIFAQAILMFPGMVLNGLGGSLDDANFLKDYVQTASAWFQPGHPF